MKKVKKDKQVKKVKKVSTVKKVKKVKNVQGWRRRGFGIVNESGKVRVFLGWELFLGGRFPKTEIVAAGGRISPS